MTRATSDRSTPANPLYAYVGAFVSELRRAGIAHVVICPGSRSTPLALACAEEEGLRVWMHIDERAAAFFALGMAKRLASPVALLCTSGTAAANFFPAIIEARLTRVPLVILTADRPHELRDCGAPQAIDQIRLYGVYVKWFMDAALPEATTTALRYIRTLANRAVALARARPAGPVHLNLPFREPLTPEPQPQLLPPTTERDPFAWEGRAEQVPYVRVTESEGAGLPAAEVARLATLLRQHRRGLIIAGPQSQPGLAPVLQRLAERCGYPLLADPLSQVRSSGQSTGSVLCSYDAFLRSERFVTSAAPELVLRFGAMPTSKPLLLYLQRYADRPLLVVDEAGGWEEPTQLASEMLHADPVVVCEQLVEALAQTGSNEEHQEGWLDHWQQAERLTQQVLRRTMETFRPLFEGRVFSELAELLPDGSTLYASNSMPVRDLDTFFWSTRRIRCLGNRGANGIDGLLSSALGVSAAQQTLADAGPVVLVIGDLAFLHDLNGLIAAHLHRLPLLVILINNDGGGIFSFLPQAAYPQHFEQLFGTPTGLNFAPAVEMYGGRFRRVRSWEEFRHACREGLRDGGLQVIEVVTERASNVQLHRQLWRAVDQALPSVASEGV
ncbi:2-succinyl-5-enolpyruvyl-6-hydroxy-3-cyclohexene-1-carboxylic-acid synthase [Thermogemmatispora carboxidivorans]|uniref:2-succinyl-5-enolpyruvyl-6-hydroxy-3- cyclohexene-1-carboxylic-acid synthase n=1 Tax=Thermogemmatispora carboxidivorans TaxID=1382306 RepID=UPI00069A7885|nr:2-succinyl-5-enolpyruvyl-6-hydroxy-3-cyclohexene-1-carboxylic-acid synthase [Thermogemmatispora carboxidivorans]